MSCLTLLSVALGYIILTKSCIGQMIHYLADSTLMHHSVSTLGHELPTKTDKHNQRQTDTCTDRHTDTGVEPTCGYDMCSSQNSMCFDACGSACDQTHADTPHCVYRTSGLGLQQSRC